MRERAGVRSMAFGLLLRGADRRRLRTLSRREVSKLDHRGRRLSTRPLRLRAPEARNGSSRRASRARVSTRKTAKPGRSAIIDAMKRSAIAVPKCAWSGWPRTGGRRLRRSGPRQAREEDRLADQRHAPVEDCGSRASHRSCSPPRLARSIGSICRARSTIRERRPGADVQECPDPGEQEDRARRRAG